MEKLIKDWSYSIDDYGEMTVYVEDMEGHEYSVATLSDCEEEAAEEIAEEVLAELGYQLKEE